MKTIEQLRAEIDKLNKEIVELLAKRMEVAGGIAEYKRQRGLPVHAPEREKRVIENVKNIAKEKGLDEKIAEDIFLKIIEHTRNSEKEKMQNNR
ncbi:MAG: chorismate mutase [Nanoarchaeota archaeon]|nr:chorismate mutase [Nanoarchaeota archaeon]